MRAQLVAGAALGMAMAAATGAAAEQNPLAAYAGKYPGFDKVNGATFVQQPAVIAGVRKAVPDKAVLDWVLSPDATEVPIAITGGKLVAHACEPHNCGDHQWAIVIELASGATDVCYFDGATMKARQSRWYLAAGTTALRAGDCPSE